ncbi:MAG TPA: undecaprenyl-phosphate galactose phosphotransferase WbaP [Nitrospirae bacterium]|nr:UDP-glucose:undecaprenyl-phosphate glucose-1-phosphate transferase [bacterium BMS3Abin06]HDH12885.1 undecaprenyl-phosphate galactose phosphotransferase WbaP [Nitrospirota bacterium]HDZ00493.1 undecaprenyl-phosphate galactose phosphotransferase WbaP [Nitrospirota bacterium]
MSRKIFGIILLFLIDAATVFTALQGAIFLRKHILSSFFEFPEFPQIDVTFFWWVFPVWLFFLAYEGLYIKRFSFWDEVKMLWKVVFFSTLGVFTILYLGKIGERVSRTVLVVMGIISFPILPVVRINAKKLLIFMGLLKSKVLILGAGKTGELIFNALKRDKNLGLNVVGFLDDDPKKIGKKIGGIKIHAGVDKAQKYIGRCGIENIVIAMPGCEKKKFISLINNLQHKARNILLIPDLFGITVLGTNLQHFFQEQVIGLEVKNNLAQPANILIKKLFDLIVSCALLIVLSIPMIIIAILIKINSKGPAIFSQERRGKNDKPFRCYKFRTMYNDAETRLNTLLETSEEARDEWIHHWKLKNDPRITKIGRFLRQTSLDELPQIFNVLRGNMSLVGPRPVTKREITEYYREHAGLCFGVPPGITGLWQVSGRSNTGYEYRIALDSWYVRNWNLWLDIVILLKTMKAVIRSEGAW